MPTALTELSYYDWEGIPCRIVELPNGEHAERYVPGVGFEPIPYLLVQEEGDAISKAAFQRAVIEMRKS